MFRATDSRTVAFICETNGRGTLFCLAGPQHLRLAMWLAIAALALVISGWRPRAARGAPSRPLPRHGLKIRVSLVRFRPWPLKAAHPKRVRRFAFHPTRREELAPLRLRHRGGTRHEMNLPRCWLLKSVDHRGRRERRRRSERPEPFSVSSAASATSAIHARAIARVAVRAQNAFTRPATSGALHVARRQSLLSRRGAGARVEAAFAFHLAIETEKNLRLGMSLDAAALLAAAALACRLPTRRVTRLDPVRSLRAE